MKQTVFRILSVCLLLACMTVIFSFSSQEADESNGSSSRVVDFIIHVLYPEYEAEPSLAPPDFYDDLTTFVRKGAHFSIYALLGVFSMMTMTSFLGMKRKSGCFAFLISILYASSDEIHQTFVAGRSGELRDVLIDSSGALLGILLCVGIIFLIRIICNKRKQV